MGPRQLSFVFADSPPGDGKDERSDASEQRSFLLHKAKRKKTSGSNASVADTCRLLEEAASEANLARALLNVVRNKGAPGVDAQLTNLPATAATAIRLACRLMFSICPFSVYSCPSYVVTPLPLLCTDKWRDSSSRRTKARIASKAFRATPCFIDLCALAAGGRRSEHAC